jgi:para-nitrobenzyl esterase
VGNLATNMVYAWTDADEQLSELMQQYYVNFVRSGDPNARGLPQWRPANVGDTVRLMRLDLESAMERERHRARYLLLDELIGRTLAR